MVTTSLLINVSMLILSFQPCVLLTLHFISDTLIHNFQAKMCVK
jgi:hypothetical protein